MADRNSGQAQLPGDIRRNQLQRISFAQLSVAIPHDRFILRGEDGDDKGVDKTLEILEGSSATNIRAQVQVKSTDADDFNNDGSLSFPIETANLNHLLNGTSGLYVLWIDPKKQLRYAWARDEATRLHREKPTWEDQETITIRFQKLLDQAAWDEIYERVSREGRAHRLSMDAYASATSREGVKLAITENLDVVTPDQALHTIRADGINLVSSGYGKAVLQYATLLNTAQSSTAIVQLVTGYSHFNLGDYHAARSQLGRAFVGRAELIPFEQAFLEHLLNTCDLYLGRIDEPTYYLRSEDIEKRAPATLGKQLRFDRLCKQCFASNDRDARNPLLTELKKLAVEVEADPNIPNATKVQVAQIRWLTDMAAGTSAWFRAASKPLLRSAIGLPGLTNSVVADMKATSDAINSTYDELAQLRARTADIGNPSLLAESLIVGVLPIIARFMSMLVTTRISGREPLAVPDEINLDIISKLETAAKLFQENANDEGRSRAYYLLAGWHDMNDRTADATGYAQQLLALSQALGYDQKAREAESILAGQSEYRRLLEKIRQPRDVDFFLATRTDEQLRAKCLDMLDAMGLPADRLPAILKMSQADRRLAIERTTWCRHMALEGGAYTDPTSPDYMKENPVYRVFCQVWPYRTRRWLPELDEPIAWFKRVYCAACGDRCAKTDPRTTVPPTPPG
jgi:hypothetical protein